MDPSAAVAIQVQIDSFPDLAAGDTIRIDGFQDSGGTLAYDVGTTLCSFTAFYLGA